MLHFWVGLCPWLMGYSEGSFVVLFGCLFVMVEKSGWFLVRSNFGYHLVGLEVGVCYPFVG